MADVATLKLLSSIVIFIAIAESSPALREEIVSVMGIAHVNDSTNFQALGPPYLLSAQKLEMCDQHRSDADECNRMFVQNFLQNSKIGYEDLGIAPFDPLHAPAMEITDGSGLFGVLIKESQLTGFSDMNVTSVKISPNERIFEITGTVPKFSLVGKYSMSGEFLSMPASGLGDINITMENTKTMFTYRGNLTRKGCHLFLNITHFIFHVQPEKMISHYANLIEGNEALAKSTMNLLNQFDDEVFTIMGPSINRELTRILWPLFQEFHDKLAYDEMFADFKIPCSEDSSTR